MLNNHFASKHPELLPESARSKFWCPECGKYYHLLSFHKRMVHERPFACPLDGCDFCTGRIEDLKTHLHSKHDLTTDNARKTVAAVTNEWSRATGRTLQRGRPSQVFDPDQLDPAKAGISIPPMEEPVSPPAVAPPPRVIEPVAEPPMVIQPHVPQIVTSSDPIPAPSARL